jgi:hypothetical protein
MQYDNELLPENGAIKANPEMSGCQTTGHFNADSAPALSQGG